MSIGSGILTYRSFPGDQRSPTIVVLLSEPPSRKIRIEDASRQAFTLIGPESFYGRMYPIPGVAVAQIAELFKLQDHFQLVGIVSG